MRLQRLTGLERDKIINEFEELLKKIDWYKQILGDEKIVLKIIRDEFEEIREQYGDDRRTEIIEAPDEILPEDMIARENMVVTITHAIAIWASGSLGSNETASAASSKASSCRS